MPRFGINPALLQRLANPVFDPQTAVTQGLALGERMRSNRADEAYRQETLGLKKEQLGIERAKAVLDTTERLEKYQAKKELLKRIDELGMSEQDSSMAKALARNNVNEAMEFIDKKSGDYIKRKREEAEAGWKPYERLREEAEIKATTTKQTNRDKEIENTKSYLRDIYKLSDQGISDDQLTQQAAAIADGIVKVEVSEDGREVVLTDIAKATAGVPGAVQRQLIQQPLVEEPKTPAVPYEETVVGQVEHATGPTSQILAWTARIPFMTPSEIEKKTIQARQSLKLVFSDLRRSMAVNRKFPVAEMQWLQAALDTDPSIWDNPGALRQRLFAVDRDLETALTQAERDADNIQLDAKTRQNRQDLITSIKSTREKLGVKREKDKLEVKALYDSGRITYEEAAEKLKAIK
jgi:hypothetical protein